MHRELAQDVAAGAGPWPEIRALPVRRRLRRRRWLISLAATLVIAGLNAMASAAPTPTERVLASAILAIAGLIIAESLVAPGRVNPFLAVFVGIYAMSYALPVFLLEEYKRGYYLADVIPDRDIEEALALAAAGLGVCLLGYRLGMIRLLRSRIPALRMDWRDPRIVTVLGVALGMAGIGVYALESTLAIPVAVQQLVHFVGDLSVMGILMLFALQLTRRLGLAAGVFLWVILVPTRVFFGLASGSTWQGIEIGLALVVGYGLVRNRVPWRSAAVVAIALGLLLPARSEFRAQTWSGEGAEWGLAQKGALYLRLMAESLPTADLEGTVQISMSRLAHLMTLGEVVARTPGEVPFWMGETYYALLFKVIPRFLYPDKPTVETGQTFGHRYGFLDPSDTTTSYNLPQLVELYANFGWTGVLAGMLVVGVLYGVVVRLFVHDQAGLGAKAAGAYVLAKLLLIESSAALVFGGLLWNCVFVAMAHGIVRVVHAASGKMGR